MRLEEVLLGRLDGVPSKQPKAGASEFNEVENCKIKSLSAKRRTGPGERRLEEASVGRLEVAPAKRAEAEASSSSCVSPEIRNATAVPTVSLVSETAGPIRGRDDQHANSRSPQGLKFGEELSAIRPRTF